MTSVKLVLGGGRVDSILGKESQQTQKLKKLPTVMSHFYETCQGKFASKYLLINGRDFRHLLSRKEYGGFSYGGQKQKN